MENQKCCKCGKENPDYTYRFIVVDQNSSSYTARQGGRQVTTTTTTEQIKGVDRESFCKNCIKNKRLGTSIGRALGALVGGFVVVFMSFVFFGGDVINDHAGTIAIISLVIGAIAAAITFIINNMKEDPFVAGMILSKMKKNTSLGDSINNFNEGTTKSLKFIPVDSNLYIPKNSSQPDLQTFQSKSDLKTNVGSTLYLLFIAPGKGDELVDGLLEKGNDAAASLLAMGNNTGGEANS